MLAKKRVKAPTHKRKAPDIASTPPNPPDTKATTVADAPSSAMPSSPVVMSPHTTFDKMTDDPAGAQSTPPAGDTTVETIIRDGSPGVIPAASGASANVVNVATTAEVDATYGMVTDARVPLLQTLIRLYLGDEKVTGAPSSTMPQLPPKVKGVLSDLLRSLEDPVEVLVNDSGVGE
ncbi:hypothetical protein GUJ93_ZPchr0009g1676 [Zizania palustris]|uniref:Uncharacterized protein n=1 Tax=Zizania palustris TaxID=103762 RepID=A0A8J5S722_ZIZPA|nr:hypothetical protein GUJ93_ZPchr0009g1676 [Zizania palustris]